MHGRARWAVAATAAVAIGLVGAPSAGAATPIGETFVPPGACSGGFTQIQSDSPGDQYTVPFDGVITSWSYQAPASPPELKFKVVRPEDGVRFMTVGESAVKTPTAGMLNTYSDIRVAVRAGDVIGVFLETTGNCGVGSQAASYVFSYVTADPPPGTSASYDSATGFKYDISATLEPDCDVDGFGDETQDASVDCDPPNATITKRPPSKTKKAKVTFEFTGIDVRAIAGFQCKLDAAAFAACTSPHKVRVKKGKHTFQVQAIDQAGNVGAPATDSWKRKKKKR